HEFIGPAYDPSRDLSPNLPSCESSMGDVDPSISSGSSCSTPSNNNHQSSCSSEICRPHHQTSSSDCRQQQQQQGNADVCRTPADFPHTSFEHQIPKLEPLQPPRTPPTPPTNADEAAAVCAGCGLRIADRFYLQAVDRRWHAACLQCCQCRNTLDGEITCFSKDGNIYCKKDYYSHGRTFK
ncbi:LIM domain containing protein, partial [Oryctes borbonicus]